MNLELQQELLRRYPKIFRKPERRPGPAIVLAETSGTSGTHPEKERTPHRGADTPLPHLERPGWTVFDERGFECGDGWFDIVDRLARVFETEIDTMIASGTPKPRWPRIRQCKEKLGSLRFYVSFPGGIPDRVRQHLLAAEAESRRICESCGEANSRNDTAPTESWCDRCHAATTASESTFDSTKYARYVQDNLKVREMLHNRSE